MSWRRTGILLAIALLLPAAARAQAGPWAPIGSRIDGLAAWLVAEGGLGDIDPLTRPWRLAELRHAAAAQDSLALRPAGRRALGWLQAELALVADSTVLSAEVGGAFYRNGRRDSFRSGGASGASPIVAVWGSLSRGPLVIVLNPAIENRLRDDPEYAGYTVPFVAGRLQNAYLAVTGVTADGFLGRMARQWGPPLFQGLMLSPSAYAQDEFAGTLRLGRLALGGIAQRLDDLPGDSTAPGTPMNRYFFAHRLTIAAGRGVWIALTESGVYGGPGRGFEPAFLAPLGVAVLAEFNEQRKVNAMWGVEFHAPLGPLTIAAQGVIDDIQLDDSVLTDQRPTSGGFTTVLSGRVPGAPAHWSLGYTRVGALTYRNSFRPYEIYALQGIGLGRNFSDYDQLMVRVAAMPARSWNVALDVSYLRQGSGDFRQAFPSDSVLAQPGQGFLVAPVRSAAAVRIQGDAEPRPGFVLRGEIGVDGNLAGPARVIADVRLSLRFDVLARRLGSPWAGVDDSR